MSIEVNTYLPEGARMELTNALLLYTAPSHQMATIHKVYSPGEGAPVILPGECLTREGIEEILASLSKAPTKRHILPASVLCATPSLLCWWKPAKRLPIFFNTNEKKFNTEVSGKEVLHPPLVFLAKPGRLQILALTENERPTAETLLFRAPYYNLYGGSGYDEGAMCRGNVRLPEVVLPRDIPLWEKAFFETNFTHSNFHGAKLTSHPGGHDGLWRVAREWGDEPFIEGCAHARYLIPLKLTLEEAVNK